MRLGERWLDQEAGCSGRIVQIVLLSGDDVDHVPVKDHDLIGSLVVETDAGEWVVYGGRFVEGVDIEPIASAIN